MSRQQDAAWRSSGRCRVGGEVPVRAACVSVATAAALGTGRCPRKPLSTDSTRSATRSSRVSEVCDFLGKGTRSLRSTNDRRAPPRSGRGPLRSPRQGGDGEGEPAAGFSASRAACPDRVGARGRRADRRGSQQPRVGQTIFVSEHGEVPRAQHHGQLDV